MVFATFGAGLLCTMVTLYFEYDFTPLIVRTLVTTCLVGFPKGPSGCEEQTNDDGSGRRNHKSQRGMCLLVFI